MTLDELIERLEEIRETHGGSAEVALAVQPNYPLRERLRGVAFADDAEVLPDLHEDHEEGPDADPMKCEKCQKAQETVWLVSGGQASSYDASPYAPGWVMENAY